MRKIIFLFIVICGFTISLDAQSYGYCNGGNLVEAVALKEKSDDALTAFQAPLISKGQDMVLALKESEKKFYQEIEKGILSQIAMQERQQELGMQAKALEDYEQEVSDKIAAKRQELLNPILEKVQAAIDEVAKAKGYKMVFDESAVSAVLFGDAALDITADVKVKLGL